LQKYVEFENTVKLHGTKITQSVDSIVENVHSPHLLHTKKKDKETGTEVDIMAVLVDGGMKGWTDLNDSKNLGLLY
jgi:hypothetical protein